MSTRLGIVPQARYHAMVALLALSLRLLVLCTDLAAVAAGSHGAGVQTVQTVADCVADPRHALTTARDAIRAMRAAAGAGARPPALVEVRGLCRLRAPLELGPMDSAVRWEGGAISGGIEVGGWREGFAAGCVGCGTVWVAELPAGTAPARQLWVDGVRANRTQLRFAQEGAVKTDTGINTTVGANWSRPSAIEVVYAGNQFCLGKALRQPSSPNFFTWQRVPVASVGETEIVLSPTALAHVPLVPRQAALGLPCWVENVFELLGENSTGRVGDYYHDSTAQKLYYVSPSAPTGVVLPQSSALVSLKNATGVSFANTTFVHTTWLFGDDGYTQIQAGCTNRKDRLAAAPADEDPSTACLPTPAAVEVASSREIRFVDCVFRNLGTSGVHFFGGAHDNAVERSRFFDLSASAVLFGGVDTYNISDPARQDAGLTVADCTIHNVGHEYPGNCGITAFYSRGLRVLHNEIFDIPYTGASLTAPSISLPLARYHICRGVAA